MLTLADNEISDYQAAVMGTEPQVGEMKQDFLLGVVALVG
jgi:hypothetical protein